MYYFTEQCKLLNEIGYIASYNYLNFNCGYWIFNNKYTI